jgi:hypothetical protein
VVVVEVGVLSGGGCEGVFFCKVHGLALGRAGTSAHSTIENWLVLIGPYTACL